MSRQKLAVSGAAPAVADEDTASRTIGIWGNVVKEILFYVGFLLIIMLFSEEFARAVKRLQAHVQQYPQHRIIVYPLVLVLIVVAGIIIANSLIRLCTGFSFSYD
jgi:uncharacterized protein YacL